METQTPERARTADSARDRDEDESFRGLPAQRADADPARRAGDADPKTDNTESKSGDADRLSAVAVVRVPEAGRSDSADRAGHNTDMDSDSNVANDEFSRGETPERGPAAGREDDVWLAPGRTSTRDHDVGDDSGSHTNDQDKGETGRAVSGTVADALAGGVVPSACSSTAGNG
jgi:hypothetical protein